ncbi:PaaI family thioesterase [Rhodovulum sp. BSW8]|uniref:PaaI family thioesterase n=1 Tax=Rhodovulum visakhapatnamense TaxID=364297 RepID=A0ABS1RJB2_9RHOB|nr:MULTISPECIES: PaaI family thioesterase [Rhodovulum]MBL3570953.1 PaaI family thioesterase [Rhodovulum visakhapatnamense]MBL3579745.1 PaaI family thioesterase [Rhodovulum visakhapatnamense]OLS44713.1 thioesterase [Rhodovulum sulfidophilum]RBO54405.1 PaaI family thioesterase [Rhodovulum sp. BSW8]
MQPVMDVAALTAFLRSAFPQVGEEFVVEEVAPMRVRVRLAVTDRHLRPGGTVSGPSMFALADVGIYLAVLAMIGPKALAVTTNCSIDFMRKPAAGRDLICEARLLKLGRVLAVGDAMIRSDGSDEIVARASLTYSIPPK